MRRPAALAATSSAETSDSLPDQDVGVSAVRSQGVLDCYAARGVELHQSLKVSACGSIGRNRDCVFCGVSFGSFQPDGDAPQSPQ